MNTWDGLTPPYATIVADPPWPYPDGWPEDLRLVLLAEGLRAKRFTVRDIKRASLVIDDALIPPSLCDECGALFKFSRQKKRFCSSTCGARYHGRRRRAQTSGLFRPGVVELVTIGMLIERDGENCYLCGEYADPAERSVDHVIALSCGGSHTMANTRLAHFKCNTRKGAMSLAAYRRKYGGPQ